MRFIKEIIIVGQNFGNTLFLFFYAYSDYNSYIRNKRNKNFNNIIGDKTPT